MNRLSKSQYLGKVPEKTIEKNILQYLETAGITAWGQNNGAIVIRERGNQRYYKTVYDHRGQTFQGISDICGYINGRSLFIEVKRPGKKATAHQANFLKNAVDSGCIAFVATSVQDVVDHLNSFKPPKKS